MKSSFQNRLEPVREALPCAPTRPLASPFARARSLPRSTLSHLALSHLAPLAAALFTAALGCSGPEYATPRYEPEGTILRPPLLAQPDTFECLKEGSEIVPAAAGDAADPADAAAPPVCCEGLSRAEVYKGSILRLDECQPEGMGHAFCIRCGDGRCGVGENTCSCPADCHWP